MSDAPITPEERTAVARHGYSSTQIFLHWTVAVLVLVNWLLGEGMAEVFDARMEGEAISQWGPAFVHIAIGLIVLGLMVSRLLVRLRRPVSTAGDTKYPILAKLGAVTHWAFYAVVILMPLLGLVAWFGGSEAMGEAHDVLSKVLVALVILHVGGALLHLVLGENILRRMARPTAGT